VTGLGDADLMGFVATTDLARAEAFYRDVLGLRHVCTDEFAVVFDAHGSTLRVTLVSERAPAHYTVLGWRVDDIVAALVDLSARGVTFNRYEGLEQDDDAVWTAPDGARIAWFADPDGNTLSLTQFPT
jgi:catechol 2,3-dioxygenase-like lactoylglutathione lyase family enzyme